MKKRTLFWIAIVAFVFCLAGCFANIDNSAISIGDQSTNVNSNIGEEVTIHCDSHTLVNERPLKKDGSGYHFSAVCSNCGKEETVSYDALVTFLDDDARAEALLHWEKIMDATGIPMTSAVITGKPKDVTGEIGSFTYAGWDMIEHMKEKGVDFVHHTYHHKNLTTLSPEEIQNDFEAAKKTLSEHGIDSQILVYPNNAYDEMVTSIVKQYFDAAITCGNKTNAFPLEEPFAIHRVNINDSKNVKTITFDDNGVVKDENPSGSTYTAECNGLRSFDEMNEYVNMAAKEHNWLVFMVHAHDSPRGQFYFDENCENEIIEFCKYTQKQGNVKFITVTEALQFSNLCV